MPFSLLVAFRSGDPIVAVFPDEPSRSPNRCIASSKGLSKATRSLGYSNLSHLEPCFYINYLVNASLEC